MVIWVILPFSLVLAYFSYLDIKEGEIPNEHIVFAGIMGILLAVWQRYMSYELVFACIVFFLFGFFLWKTKIFGGADVKTLTIIPFFLFVANTEILFKSFQFIVVIAIAGSIYGLIMKQMKKKSVPFMPILLFGYIFSSFL